ncbi:hypothetical protein J2Z48_002346 [Croceifilum oryzae]|uniref:SpaA-like prealbumin fold domain-containing protein n=1 Tax=Croceifilum oryzae TaxID=1553429 RepID=A0AAJ1TKF7_9BACL|nr:SpaA isopeptide-forming pilin-related protein [Croceifilum oryzae]MDQ0418157.1 hypothetical protein [Croceifilum oryzae]
MKRTIQFLSMFVLVGSLIFGGVSNATHVANASSTYKVETGTLEITVFGKDWRYSPSDPSGFEYFLTKLSNVEFTIYKDGKEYTKQRTNQDGKMNLQLPVGSYKFTQTTAYPNYPKYPPYPEFPFATFFPDKSEFSVRIDKGRVASYKVYNEPISSEIYGINPW